VQRTEARDKNLILVLVGSAGLEPATSRRAGEIFVELRAAVHPDRWCRIQSFSLTKPSSRLATSPGLVAAMVAHFMATDRTFARIGGICLLTNKYEQPTFG
jgi:hypothetical protein